VRFLRAASPEQPLRLSPVGCVSPRPIIAPIRLAASQDTAAATRVVPWIALAVTEFGRDSGGENIAYGKTTARAIVLTLIIDDGRLGRPHRKNIFNPNFNYAGAAYGPHALYGSVCSINFASGYTEGRPSRSSSKTFR